MELEKEDLLDALSSFWTEGAAGLDAERRALCRELSEFLADSLSGRELLAWQGAPGRYRGEIGERVGAWLAKRRAEQGERPPVSAPAGSVIHIRQSNENGVNIGTIGSIQGGFNLTAPAAARPRSAEPPAGGEARSEAVDLRVLLLCANPEGTAPLRLDEEARAIDRALRASTEPKRCALTQKWAVRVGELQEHLLHTKPSLVHFSGHGLRDRALALQGEDGVSRPVSAERLARLLGRFHPRLRCVVLNACSTREHGEAIAEKIDCVVGMSTRISDPAALRFSSAFYLALGSGTSVLDAFEQARSDIELGEIEESEAPVLIARNADPARVFLVHSA